MSRTWRCAGIPPVPAPTLALDFIANPAVPPGFALSRASSATWTGTDGVIYTAGPNVARFDADPATLAPGGLLLEPARTNQHASSLYSGKGGPRTVPSRERMASTLQTALWPPPGL